MSNGQDPILSPPGIAVPGQAVWLAIDRMTGAAARVESVLAPSIFRRLIGGANRELGRAVVAAAFEESGMARRTLIDMAEAAIKQASGLEVVAGSGGEGSAMAQQAASQARAMAGTCERLKEMIDRWRDAALAHQENEVGATEKLLNVSRRFQTLAKDIRTPASGLYS